ncbi:MAG TPA: hypothetical protein VM662_09250 [Sphingomonas sp.]|nr:hypothetical protein [Sphingomonas sp.]
MTTALGTVFAEIDARLSAIVNPQAGSYQRMPSGDPDAYPALQAYDEGDEPASEQEVSASRNDLFLTVEGYMQGSGGGPTHDAMLELHADVVFALCGDAGSNLGGLVENIEAVGQRRVAVAELASTRRLGFAQDFRITLSTRRGDPHQFA